jgi:N-acetylglucosaminyl-diphospho-decaprenol L-rhamnosyltransferase
LCQEYGASLLHNRASLAIVIVNFRTPALTVQCLRSLAKEPAVICNSQVVIVENGSGDDSADRILSEIRSRSWENWAVLLSSARNLGFAGGNNLGLRWIQQYLVGTGYILLLNSDTIVPSDVLPYCRRLMETEPKIGMMSCRLRCADGTTQNVTRDFPSPFRQTICALGLPWYLPRIFGWANVNELAESKLTDKRDCDWIGGAFMFIRRSALEKVGLLDESFFFYGEDIEFCFRFRKAGYRVHYDPTYAITHLGGGSSDPTRLSTALRNRHMWQARYLVQRKCYGIVAAWWLRFVDVAVFTLRKFVLLCMGQRAGEKYRDTSASLAILLRRLDAKA